jgi:hypothetical protein
MFSQQRRHLFHDLPHQLLKSLFFQLRLRPWPSLPKLRIGMTASIPQTPRAAVLNTD